MNPAQKNWLIGITVVFVIGMSLLLKRFWPICILVFGYQAFKILKALETGEIKSNLSFSHSYRESSYDQDESPTMYVLAFAFEFLFGLAAFIAIFVTL